MQFIMWVVSGFVTMFVAPPVGRHRPGVISAGRHRLATPA